MRMISTQKGGQSLLNGRKSFVTNGRVADKYVVFGKTDPARGRRVFWPFWLIKDCQE